MRSLSVLGINLHPLLLSFIAALAGIMLGSTHIDISNVSDFVNSPNGRILIYVRLPRTLAALVCGGALSVSGAVMQAVLANRLASPGVVGVNAGAGVAVTICTAFGIIGGWQTAVAAFIGAFGAVMTVSLAARKLNASRGTVILMGVAMNSMLGAITDSIITFIPDVSVMSNNFKIGEFSAVTYNTLIPAAVMIALAIFALLTLSDRLDVITLGDDTAKGLGLNTPLMRTLFLLFAALQGCWQARLAARLYPQYSTIR